MGMWHFGGESRIDDGKMYVKSQNHPSVEYHSCSLCKHFTSNVDNLCLVNPEVVKQRITYDDYVNIFCCDLKIVCDKFERDYDKMNGWVT